MGDHFVLLVDRLLTESPLEATIESKNQSQEVAPSAEEARITNSSSHKMDFGSGSFPRKLVECRFCHDEDEDPNMETPCSCCGSLKLKVGFNLCNFSHQKFSLFCI
ncbi:hypothetical protein HHK36_006855 [Tetracentron sinense]|uniref:Uncharacterized protein n=1 Tax=Tetracentron sinense TaxID=13715 RepID=A0A834ZHX0_TETSI|nr:hypothetical protein HHK36_006855 [Tetracentron sinense]